MVAPFDHAARFPFAATASFRVNAGCPVAASLASLQISSRTTTGRFLPRPWLHPCPSHERHDQLSGDQAMRTGELLDIAPERIVAHAAVLVLLLHDMQLPFDDAAQALGS